MIVESAFAELLERHHRGLVSRDDVVNHFYKHAHPRLFRLCKRFAAWHRRSDRLLCDAMETGKSTFLGLVFSFVPSQDRVTFPLWLVIPAVPFLLAISLACFIAVGFLLPIRLVLRVSHFFCVRHRDKYDCELPLKQSSLQ